MKSKILTIIMSFIFLYILFSNIAYSTTNEVVTENNEKIELIKNEIIDNQIGDNINKNSNNNEPKEDINNIIKEDINNECENEIYENKIYENDYNEVANQVVDKDKVNNKSVENKANNVIINEKEELVIDNAVENSIPVIDNILKTETKEENNIIENILDIKTEDSSKTDASYINYVGESYLDLPGNSQRFLMPDNKNLQIAGWAVSTDSNAVLEIYLDNRKVNCKISRFQRQDVNNIIFPRYGINRSQTPYAGFITNINIEYLNNGNHIVKFVQKSRYGKVISTSQKVIVTNKRNYSGQSYIDVPLNSQKFILEDTKQINIAGWCVSNDTNSVLEVYLDNKKVNCRISRFKRQDVNNLMKNKYNLTNSQMQSTGFVTNLNVQSIGKGTHTLKVIQKSRYGNIISTTERKILFENKKYIGESYIDVPTNLQNLIIQDDKIITFAGWAISNDSKSVLEIYLDNKKLNTRIDRISRTDVNRIKFPQYGITERETPLAGFYSKINIESLSKGEHSLKLILKSRNGNIISTSNQRFRLENKKILGESYIDIPSNLQKFIIPNDKKIKVEGWSISQDSKSIIEIYLDDKKVNAKIDRISRPDVNNIKFPLYNITTSQTPLAGFSTQIDIDSLSKGNHIVKLVSKSSYGDVISTSERQIVVQNPKYLGEMCVDYPINNSNYKYGEYVDIAGWAVSQDENAIIEIYVDGKYNSNASRYVRPDVEYYSQKYGGKTINAGFGKKINTSDFGIGTHKITIYEKSRYGDIIGGVETMFSVYNEKNVSNSDNSNQSYKDYSNENVNAREITNYNDGIITSGTKGIDVSQHQGNINWKDVSNSGIKFAMIRIGYRGYGTGRIVEDSKFQYNFKNSVANKIATGIYYYSTAVNSKEAREDAEYIYSVVKKYGYNNMIGMPVAIDLEVNPGTNSRDLNVSKDTRTNIANTFCNEISKYGYIPMVYASKAFLNDNMYKTKISSDIWVAQYNSKCTYQGKYTIWQYSNKGKIPGINGNVDLDYCYKNY